MLEGINNIIYSNSKGYPKVLISSLINLQLIKSGKLNTFSRKIFSRIEINIYLSYFRKM